MAKQYQCLLSCPVDCNLSHGWGYPVDKYFLNSLIIHDKKAKEITITIYFSNFSSHAVDINLTNGLHYPVFEQLVPGLQLGRQLS